MTLEEQISDQERLIYNAMEEKRSQSIVYRMMEIYEDLYGELKRPNCKQENSYIHLYWKYIAYMERN